MCEECGHMPAGWTVDEAFKFPPPYKLAGPEPTEDATDVHSIVDACIDNGHPYRMSRGLVMLAGTGGTYLNPKRQWFISFDVADNGHHKFHEASCGDMLITRLVDLLAYLRSNPEPE